MLALAGDGEENYLSGIHMSICGSREQGKAISISAGYRGTGSLASAGLCMAVLGVKLELAKSHGFHPRKRDSTEVLVKSLM